MLRALELGRNHMEMRDPGTIAGGRPPALLRQSKGQRHVKAWTLEEWDLR